ncbi:related to Oxidation resistance protein 1 [Saccharomycodes ludwigii]|uniref:Oxidation resistance protein 1 n=1 Tax=Saccharomycodes ludwigii TaxID=36035 RepID=A0A376B6C9_9ASCO|nr:hypothetical protein SCDLUD_001090 [Saccharomycodes ludwigii]KAH3903450.1 hypothetical protein SCDLUD_001090 [Saccharomycodes ludwigii]SSD60191.1 related to Oxidation resistance protein 1 [Saccharomycodes ludwigii]
MSWTEKIFSKKNKNETPKSELPSSLQANMTRIPIEIENKELKTNSDSKNSSFIDQDDNSLPPIKLLGYSPTTKHRLLTPEMCDEIRSLMPTRIQLYSSWTLLYSLEQHGASLTSLYSRIKPGNSDVPARTGSRVGYVIIIQDRKNGIFGGYSNEYFHPTDSRRYYGNGECFLWKLEKTNNIFMFDNKEGRTQHECIKFQGYPYTGLNEFSIYCTSNFLSMGAGDGHYGLWVDQSLLNGVTDPCLTFGNDILSKEGTKFQIVSLEVWRVG